MENSNDTVKANSYNHISMSLEVKQRFLEQKEISRSNTARDNTTSISDIMKSKHLNRSSIQCHLDNLEKKYNPSSRSNLFDKSNSPSFSL